MEERKDGMMERWKDGIVDKGMLECWNKGIMEIKEGFELWVEGKRSKDQRNRKQLKAHSIKFVRRKGK